MKYAAIVAGYNCEDTIKATLISIIHQTTQPSQVIYVDDASTDESLKIVKKLKRQFHNLIIVQNPHNLGVALSRNRGVEFCSEQIVAFCDADDVWLPNKMERQIQLLQSNPGCIGAFSNRLIYDTKNVTTKFIKSPRLISKKQLLVRNYITFSSLVLQRNVFKKTKFRKINHEDYDFLLSLAENNENFYLLNTGTIDVVYKITGNNTTKNKLSSILWHVNVLKEHNICLFNIILLLIRNFKSRVVKVLV